MTYGHRFLATSGRAGRAIKVRSFDEYRKKLAENFVILSRIERRDRILRDLEAQARRIGGRALLQHHPLAEALLDEVPDLVEFPVVVAGAFSSEFLALPEEVLTTTLIHHQHFFPVLGPTGALMPAFLAVTNTQTTNERAIATNAERVVTARLRDARFFWDADRQVGLEGRLPRLETVLFHKAARARTSRRPTGSRRWHAGPPPTCSVAPRRPMPRHGRPGWPRPIWPPTWCASSPSCRARWAASTPARAASRRRSGRRSITSTCRRPSRPTRAPAPAALGAGAPAWAAVSLADKLDTLVGLFLAGERPTGSRDPFGLRRQAHGVLRILLDAQQFTGAPVRTSLGELIEHAAAAFGPDGVGREAAAGLP